MSNSNQTSQNLARTTNRPVPRISIIGAGIAGIALACRLAGNNIPFSIYEAQSQNSVGHNYAITLKRNAWKPLIRALGLPESHQNFRAAVAVDRCVQGNGQIYRDSSPKSAVFQAVDKDVRQWLIQYLVERGVQIHWCHKLTNIKEATSGNGAELSFENDVRAEADFIVDAGGLRSPAFDCNNPAAPKPRVLPYATYYGTRKYAADVFIDRFGHWFGDGNVLEFSPAKAGEPFIYLQKVHLPGDDSSNHIVQLRWLYSRPPREHDDDPLYRPNRAQQEAKSIPPQLCTEILESIKQYYSEGKRTILKQFFTLEDLKSDRILNWHLRLRLPELDYLVSNATKPNYCITAIGDAAHSLPIVHSYGANIAMDDAKEYERFLQRYISGENEASCPDSNFYKESERYKTWYAEARGALQRLREAHAQEPLGEAELEEVIGFQCDVDLSTVPDSSRVTGGESPNL